MAGVSNVGVGRGEESVPEWLCLCGGLEVLGAADAGESVAGALSGCSWV